MTLPRLFAARATLLAAALIPALSLSAMAEPAPTTITVTGEGRVASAPDMARVTMGVTAMARTAQEALAQNSQAQSAVIGVLKGAGVAAEDLQTSGLSLGPDYDHSGSGAPKLLGYRVSNSVSAQVRDLAQLGAVLDAVVTAGATEFNGLSFALQQPRATEDEARRRAVADARAKAELYAAELGGALGPVLRLSEQGSYGGGPGPMMMRAAEAAIPIEAGQVETVMSVSIDFALLPAN